MQVLGPQNPDALMDNDTETATAVEPESAATSEEPLAIDDALEIPIKG